MSRNGVANVESNRRAAIKQNFDAMRLRAASRVAVTSYPESPAAPAFHRGEKFPCIGGNGTLAFPSSVPREGFSQREVVWVMGIRRSQRTSGHNPGGSK